MSAEIINVLNYICEKLGIAIDWTAENVMPQITDVLSRYRLFALASTGIRMIIELCVIITALVVFTKAINAYIKFDATHEDNFWWEKMSYGNEPTELACILMIIFAIVGIACIIFFSINVREMLKWFFVPEVKYLEMLKNYIQ